MADASQSSTSRVAAESDESAEVEAFCDLLLGNPGGRSSASIGDPQPNPAACEALARREKIAVRYAERWRKTKPSRLISFADIARAAAQEVSPLDLDSDEAKHAWKEMLDRLAGAVARGDFEYGSGKSRILLVSADTDVFPCRLTRERYKCVARGYALTPLVREWAARENLTSLVNRIASPEPISETDAALAKHPGEASLEKIEPSKPRAQNKGGRPSRRREIEPLIKEIGLDKPNDVIAREVRRKLGGTPSKNKGLSNKVIADIAKELRHPRQS